MSKKIKISANVRSLAPFLLWLPLAIGTLPSLSPACPSIPPVTPLLLPLTVLLVDNDEVGVGVAPVLGPVHLPPVHLDLDPHVRLRFPSCSQVTPNLQGCFSQKLVFCW